MSQTVNLIYTPEDFTNASPSFVPEGGYAKHIFFASITKTLNLDNTTWGVGTYTIKYTPGIDVDYISVAFEDPNGGKISISQGNIDGLYRPSYGPNFITENIVLNNETSGNKTFYIITNGDDNIKSEYLNITVSVGRKNGPPTSNVTVSLEYDCPTTPNLYEYTTGLHTYSGYDAVASRSTLTTKLYSRTPIASWTTNTVVYSNKLLNNPALPYYYGYGTKVYKVGGDYDRAYGTKKQYEVRTKLFSKKVKTKEITLGPRLFYDPINETSEACVFPVFNDVGKIKKIFNSGDLNQPEVYRYYMGYDASNEQLSNDSVFNTYDFGTKKYYPSTGYLHAMKKLTSGIIVGYDPSFNPNAWAYGLTAAGLSLLIPGVLGGITGGLAGASLWSSTFAGCFSTSILAPLAPLAPYILVAALLIFVIIKVFQSFKTKVYKENCVNFLHHFTSTPYINLTNTLYRDPEKTVINNGYYCDGVYFYQQSSGNIISKKLSSANILVEGSDPKIIRFEYSLQADNPTLVEDWEKLELLPYLSGKPVPYCGGGTIYYSQEISDTITNPCCDLEETTETTTITLPEGAEWSCISQIDADNKAQDKFDAALAYASNWANYCQSYPDSDIGEIICNFTHEIKVETTPTECMLFYSLRSGSLSTGTTLYYDPNGCQKVLDGYYAITGSGFYRKYYHTTNGVVDAIHTQATSNSSTTDLGFTIAYDDLNYTSNWYFQNDSRIPIESYAFDIESDREFNPNSLYTTSNYPLVKGFVISSSLSDFQLYPNYTNTGSHSEAEDGWYQPLVDWISEEPFEYIRSKTLTVSTEEECGWVSGASVRGFYVTFTSGSIEVPAHNSIEITANVYNNRDTLIATYTFNVNPTTSQTFIPFDSQVGDDEILDRIDITINSPLPLNKYSYITGSSTICGVNIPVTNLTWTTSSNTTGISGCESAGWIIDNNNLSLRYNIADSINCGGTCGITQIATASANITVGGEDTYLNLSFNGIGETQSSNYEVIIFKLDGTEVARAASQGVNGGCANMGPISPIYEIQPPYFLAANSSHSFVIEFTTKDEKYHSGAYYEINLIFS